MHARLRWLCCVLQLRQALTGTDVYWRAVHPETTQNAGSGQAGLKGRISSYITLYKGLFAPPPKEAHKHEQFALLKTCRFSLRLK